MKFVTTVTYLFIICVHGFSILITRAKSDGLIKGAKVGRTGLAITCLFFTNQSILFGEATKKGARAMKVVVSDLRMYRVS